MATRKTSKSKETLAPEPKAPRAPEGSRDAVKPKKAPAKKAAPKAKAAPEAATPLLPEAVEAAPKKGAKAPKAKGAKPAPAAAEAPAEAPAEAVAVQARPKAKAKSEEPGLPPLAHAILQGLQEGRPLEFIFADSEANPPRTFEPRHLLFDTLSQAWYVWGWDRRYNAERHHRVDLLAEVNEVEGVGRSAQGPYKEGTPANQIGGWLGGEPIPVKATLMKQWIFAVKQAPAPFPEFRIAEAEDGKATVTFTATDLRAIARWCMQFGDGIQVLEPLRLVDRLRQAGIAWAGKTAAAPPPPAAPRPKEAEGHRAAPEASPKGGAPKAPRAEEPKRAPEPRHDHPRREEAKPSKGPRVEVRVERL